MKANQAFRNADEAVSPVIGVILMVAITVVLAAVVFVLVQGLTDNGASATPKILFDQTKTSGGGGTLTVSGFAQSTPVTWNAVFVGINGATPAAVGTTAGAALCSTPSVTGNVVAGQVITCGVSVTAAKITYQSGTTSGLMGDYTF